MSNTSQTAGGGRRDSEPPVRLLPSPFLAGLEAYSRLPFAGPVDLRLDGNEGTAPAHTLLDELARAGGELLRFYPDATELEADLARRLGLEAEQVVVTAGADDALRRACAAVLAPGREIVLPVPTFAMLAASARRAGGTVRTVSWPAGPYPVDAVLAAANAATAAVAVVSPNNPTGAVASAHDLRRLATALPAALLIVDLAYTEFADEDLTAAALQLPGALVVRSLSKAWGLAGLRLGYAAGPAEIIGWLRVAGDPYPVSGPSIFLARQHLSTGEQQMQLSVRTIRRERLEIQRTLRELGTEALPSQANFVLARCRDAGWLRDGLAGLGIAVRAFAEAELRGLVRITCPGNEVALQRLRCALRAVLAPAALLFDMDGVLADVSGSYRRAILETASHFGVVLSAADISRAKAVGNATNDWDLTRALMAARGVEVARSEVVQIFESIYQDTPGRPGLNQDETLLATRPLLDSLARRCPLGVVTGRPRVDALRFLKDHGLDGVFATVVAMEDAAAKPDAAPLRRALQQLGAGSGWMVGDTVDDVRAARSAGAVPLAIVSPADAGGGGVTAANAARTLLAAGAARVLNRLEDLEELLP